MKKKEEEKFEKKYYSCKNCRRFIVFFSGAYDTEKNEEKKADEIQEKYTMIRSK